MIAGLAYGAVDVIATDHAPHEPALKDVEFDRAPFGILGFETAIALTLEQLVHTKKISLTRMVELFTTGPARVLGMERKLPQASLPTSPSSRPLISDTTSTIPQQIRIAFDGRASKALRWPQ